MVKKEIIEKLKMRVSDIELFLKNSIFRKLKSGSGRIRIVRIEVFNYYSILPKNI